MKDEDAVEAEILTTLLLMSNSEPYSASTSHCLLACCRHHLLYSPCSLGLHLPDLDSTACSLLKGMKAMSMCPAFPAQSHGLMVACKTSLLDLFLPDLASSSCSLLTDLPCHLTWLEQLVVSCEQSPLLPWTLVRILKDLRHSYPRHPSQVLSWCHHLKLLD